MKEWRFIYWMGWHDAKDGTLFMGFNIEQGRVLDKPNGPQIKKFMRFARVADAVSVVFER